MSMENFRERMRRSKTTARELVFGAAAQVYDEAGRPYGDSMAGLKAWYMEGGYEEETTRRRGKRRSPG